MRSSAMNLLRLTAPLAFLLGAPLAIADSGDEGGGIAASVAECVDPVDVETLPQAKYLSTSEEYLGNMRNHLSASLALLRSAREEKDVLRLTCVNEKVAKLKGLLRISENAFISLQEADANQDPERMRYEFNKIRAGAGKMCEIYNQAANCVGVDGTYIGEPSVEFRDNGAGAYDPYYGDPSVFFDPETGLVNPPGRRIGSDSPIETRPPPVSSFLD
jgi:hypothetical protein